MNALLLVVTLAAAAPGALEQIHARGELLWGGDTQGGEPYVYEDASGKLIGFEVEIADGIARRLGVKAKFVQISWPSLVPGLQRGDFDIAMNGLEATEDRAKKILLSRPYYVYAETLAIRRGSPLATMDVRGRRVGTLSGTYAFDLLRAEHADVVPYEGAKEPYLDLAQGRIDGVLLENVIADRYGCPLAELQCITLEATRGGYAIGVRQGDDALLHAIDGALDDMERTGELKEILLRWKLWDARQEGARPGIKASQVTARSFDAHQLRLFVEGALVTLGLSLVAFVLAMLLGILLAVARVYGGPILAAASAVYVEIFRGTPVLLQLYVLYFALAPVLKLGAFAAAILGLGLNYAAYEAEIYRGALLAIPRGQSEAAYALGMSRAQAVRFVLVPQALRVALPAMTNDFVALLKDSSVVSVITVVELTKRMTIAGVDLNDWIVPGLACAALYFAMSFPLAHLARMLERRLAVDTHPRAE